jgi:chlorophyllide a hydrolase
VEIETPVWLYWLVCGVATSVLVLKRQQIPYLLSPDLKSSQPQKGYVPTIVLGWIVTLAAAIAYAVLTQKQASGSYHIPDLLIFSLLNGILEQLMFVFWFLAGCWIANRLNIQSSWMIFGFGFFSYSIYSGLIHGLFWVSVLPLHQAIGNIGIRLSLLLVMSLLWMWLFWRYRALVAIIAMHSVIDFLSIGHLHFHWFEPYQLAGWFTYVG